MFAITRRVEKSANGLTKGTMLYAATDIDWKAWVDDKTLLFKAKEDAEAQLGKHHIWETDAKVEEVETVGEFWRERFRQPMYDLADTNRSLQVCPIGSVVGKDCLTEIARYLEFLSRCNDRNHPKVMQPLLDSLRAQLEIYYYG
jgi:hypothetical protein